MFEADGNVSGEFTCMCSSMCHIAKEARGPLAVTGNSLIAGKASFNTKLISINEFCP